ncbi:MAG TPA: EF-hand domain-containing protein [Caulobacter sp.]|nr:EF-hand domain-containing protein [Caulobacter sp.]
MKTITIAAALLALSAGAATAQGMARPDANGDGKVTLSEFKANRVAMMMRGDANGDGKLSKAELEGAAAKRQAAGRGEGRGGGGRMFGMLDANNDGFLTRAEIEKMVERRFSRLDVNGDGSLSTAEVQAARKGPTGGQGGAGR